jgi:hypothetical protein
MPPMRLPHVTVSGYSAELAAGPRGGGYLGDKARSATVKEEFADRLAVKHPEAPPQLDGIGKDDVDRLLHDADAGALQDAAREAAAGFAGRLVDVIVRFLDYNYWRETERIAIGGGLAATRVGSLAIAHAAGRLLAHRPRLRVARIHHDPDDAGLIGAVQLFPSARLAGHDALLAVDIGGTKVRIGIVALGAPDLPLHAGAHVRRVAVWRHADEAPRPTRDVMVDRIAAMLDEAADHAAELGLRLAPAVGVGVPGVVDDEGRIRRGAQNVPGDWEASGFRLGRSLGDRYGRRGGVDIRVCNDAVVQGLSELPFAQDAVRWGVFTIGTGLGNAHFVNRTASDGSEAA